MLRAVAYEMLAKRERARHLAAAEHLRRAFPNDGEEVAEVIAAHLLDAYRAAAGDADETSFASGPGGPAPRRAARRDGGRPRRRRASAPHRDRARGLRARADRADRGGGANRRGGRPPRGRPRPVRARRIRHAAAGRERDAARLAGSIGHAQGHLGRHEEAITRMRAALDVLGTDDRDPDVAAINCDLGRCSSPATSTRPGPRSSARSEPPRRSSCRC